MSFRRTWFEPVRTALVMLRVLNELYPDAFVLPSLDSLWGSGSLRKALEAGADPLDPGRRQPHRRAGCGPAYCSAKDDSMIRSFEVGDGLVLAEVWTAVLSGQARFLAVFPWALRRRELSTSPCPELLGKLCALPRHSVRTILHAKTWEDMEGFHPTMYVTIPGEAFHRWPEAASSPTPRACAFHATQSPEIAKLAGPKTCESDGRAGAFGTRRR